jgi:6-pyruvoyltetrahydropterin/6-carboxytetrahydropterin synthase
MVTCSSCRETHDWWEWRKNRRKDKMEPFEITKRIGIDAAHRVTFHGSKCRNLHGHRYEVEATVAGGLFDSGEQEGMVMDFSFLKELMMEHIDAPCDHGAIIWIKDYEVLSRLLDIEDHEQQRAEFRMRDNDHNDPEHWLQCLPKYQELTAQVKQWGSYGLQGPLGKLYLVPFVPTAENLARHWYERMEERVRLRSNNNATLTRVRVYETPTSKCDYPKS